MAGGAFGLILQTGGSFRAGQPWDQSSNGILDWTGCGTSQELAFGPEQGLEATPGKPATYCMTT